jgi:hypothetical protein
MGASHESGADLQAKMVKDHLNALQNNWRSLDKLHGCITM